MATHRLMVTRTTRHIATITLNVPDDKADRLDHILSNLAENVGGSLELLVQEQTRWSELDVRYNVKSVEG